MTAPDPQIRIGYAERSAAQEALDQHLTAGRLDPDEYADRFAAAEVARTQAELDVLFADLPEPRPRSGTGSRPTAAIGAGERRDWYRYVPESVAGRIAALVVVVVAAMMLLPFVAVAVVLYFIVLPRITCGRRWSSGGPLWGGGGRPRDWLR